MVWDSFSNVIRAVFRLSKQVGHMVIIQPVFDLVSATADCLDEPAVSQQAQVVRDSGFAAPDRNGNVPNTQGPPGECVEDLRSGPVRQYLKGVNHQIKDSGIGHRVRGVDRCLWIDRGESPRSHI